jgi:hypothetical protein
MALNALIINCLRKQPDGKTVIDTDSGCRQCARRLAGGNPSYDT